MEKKRETVSVHTVDILQLRRKGLPVDKISSMLQIPIDELEAHLQLMDRYKYQSGVF